MRNLLFVLMAFLMVFSACQDDNLPNDPNTPNDPKTSVNVFVQGMVKDMEGHALEGALVVSGQYSALTDENGFFSLNELSVPSERAVFTVDKDGYFEANRAIRPFEGEHHFVQIKMIEKKLKGSFSTASGGSITVASGVQVNFPSGGIKDGNGNSYTGNVQVFAEYLDPLAENLDEFVPGDLNGVDATESNVALESYGMIGVELEDGNGDPLQLDGVEATINMEVPTSLLGTAPNTIPLWHFDETEKIWKEEGQATLQGNIYVGKVKHFSFWNCDAPFPIVHIDGRVVDPSANPVNGARVKITYNTPRYATTNVQGYFGGGVPANQVMTIEITDICGNVVYSNNIGPFTSNTNIGQIAVNLPNNQIIIQGTVQDCNNANVTNGYVRVDNATFQQFYPLAGGNFTATLPPCQTGSVLNVIGYDLTNGKQSVPQAITTASNVNLGILQACSNIDEYINVTVDNTNIFLTNVSSNANGWISGEDPNTPGGTSFVAFGVPRVANGPWPLNCEFFFNSFSPKDCAPSTSNLTAQLTSYPMFSGQYYEGTFSGTFTDINNVLRTASGTFRVKMQ